MCIPLPVVDVRALPIALWSFQRPGPHQWWWGPWTLRSFFRPFSFLLPFSLVAFCFWFLILTCFVNYCCSSHLATCFLIFTCEVNGMLAVRAGILFHAHWNIRTFCIEINTFFGEGFFCFVNTTEESFYIFLLGLICQSPKTSNKLYETATSDCYKYVISLVSFL